MIIRLDNQSTKYKTEAAAHLDAIAGALRAQLHEFAHDWGEYVFTLSEAIFASGWHIALLDNPDVANALGYHDVAPDGTPYARVFLDPIFENGGGWTSGSISVSVTVSHEMLETILDPGANRWANDAGGTLYALEACDAVESTAYDLDGVAVSDYLQPNYFNPFGTKSFDACGVIHRPFEVSKGGYAIRMHGGKIDQVFGDEYPTWKTATKTEGSRTYARELQEGR